MLLAVRTARVGGVLSQVDAPAPALSRGDRAQRGALGALGAPALGAALALQEPGAAPARAVVLQVSHPPAVASDARPPWWTTHGQMDSEHEA